MNEERNRWIEAAKVLANDASAKIQCPKCQDATLVITDQITQENPTIIERHMRCPECSTYNSLRLNREP